MKNKHFMKKRSNTYHFIQVWLTDYGLWRLTNVWTLPVSSLPFLVEVMFYVSCFSILGLNFNNRGYLVQLKSNLLWTNVLLFNSGISKMKSVSFWTTKGIICVWSVVPALDTASKVSYLHIISCKWHNTSTHHIVLGVEPAFVTSY